jgi:hypothetical protein
LAKQFTLKLGEENHSHKVYNRFKRKIKMQMDVECDCGSVKGIVQSKNLKGYRAICLCDDCQAYVHYIQRTDILDANGGTDIIPVMPLHYTFQSGIEHLKCIRLSSKGMFRWYASCCNSPMGNSMSSSAIPYVGVPAHVFAKKYSAEQIEIEFGPIRERIQAKYAKGALPPLSQKKVSFIFLLRVIKLITFALLIGAGKPFPFVKKDGSLISEPYILSKNEREALRPLCGAKRTDI